jgi:CDP-diacylglycerol--glycerol-3-phosphate 3-phosphatidyltransferase
MIKKIEEWVRNKLHFPAIFLAKTGLNPNTITLISLGIYIIAVLSIISGRDSLGGVIALVALLVNGLDGPLARVTGKTSKFGAFLDSIVDKAAETLLYFSIFILFFRNNNFGGMFVAFIALSMSVMVSFIRARAEVLGFECEVGFINPIRMGILITGVIIHQPFLILVIMVLLMIFTIIDRIVHIWSQARTTT